MIKVLVIDDEPLICAIMESYLKKIAQVQKVPSAQQALDLIPTFRPDVIISDYHMPQMTGLELVVNLRNQNNLTPVILISGSHIESNELAQFTDFLKKPVHQKDLINKIQAMLKL